MVSRRHIGLRGGLGSRKKAVNCHYCKGPFNHYDPLSERYPTVDHKRPRAKGGTNEASNLVWACAKCNQEKSDMTIAEFEEYQRVTAGPYGKLMRLKLWREHTGLMPQQSISPSGAQLTAEKQQASENVYRNRQHMLRGEHQPKKDRDNDQG